MCGRYYLENTIETETFIQKMMQSPLLGRWSDTSDILTSGEICPTNVVPVIAPDRHGQQSVFPMKWGFSGKSLLINARVETVAEKPTFRDAWKSHRCAVPASYYFEWEHLVSTDGKKKTGSKYAIRPKDSSVVWLCGLYRFENNLPVFVILTRNAAEDVRFIHDRMPLIMPGDLVEEWISPGADADDLVKKALSDMVAEKA